MAVFAVLTSVISAFYYIRLIKKLKNEKNEYWFYFAPISKGASLVLVLTAIIVIFFMLSPNLFYLLTYKIGLGLMI